MYWLQLNNIKFLLYACLYIFDQKNMYYLDDELYLMDDININYVFFFERNIPLKMKDHVESKAKMESIFKKITANFGVWNKTEYFSKNLDNVIDICQFIMKEAIEFKENSSRSIKMDDIMDLLLQYTPREINFETELFSNFLDNVIKISQSIMEEVIELKEKTFCSTKTGNIMDCIGGLCLKYTPSDINSEIPKFLDDLIDICQFIIKEAIEFKENSSRSIKMDDIMNYFSDLLLKREINSEMEYFSKFLDNCQFIIKEAIEFKKILSHNTKNDIIDYISDLFLKYRDKF